MNIGEVKRHIDRYNWYRQGAAAKMFFISFPWSTCTRMKIGEQSLVCGYEMMTFLKDLNMEMYFTKDSLRGVAMEYFSRQLRDPRFLDELISRWQREQVRPFLKMLSDFRDTDFSVMADDDVLSVYKKFRDLYLAVWQQAIFLDSFDYYSEYILDQTVQKKGCSISKEALDVLLQPPLASFLQLERLELLDIAEVVIGDRRKMESILRVNTWKEVENAWPDVAERLREHTRKYYWLQNDYASIHRLEPEYFFERLKELLEKPGQLVFGRNARSHLRQLSQLKKDIARRHHLSNDCIMVTDFLSKLGNFRDARKTYNQMANDFLHRLISVWSRRYAVPLEILEGLLFWEVEEVLRDYKSERAGITRNDELFSLARKRFTDVFFPTSFPSAEQSFYGADAVVVKEYILSHLQRSGEIRGRTAYPGRAKGVAKIIWDQRDFHKMKKGDILVAPNTRPEYVPIMKLAAAIVSDEGGLTCHSAIVSRELRIPCIVGTQTATILLKDGVEVEVDATRGVLKKV